MTRSGGPPEAAVSNIAGLSNGANPRQRPEPAGQPSEQQARSESEQQRPVRTEQVRREESRTEQLPLDGVRPDRQPGPPQPAARMPRPLVPPNRGGQATERSRVRRARLRAVRLDPWSVMKTAFLLSIAFAIVTMVSVIVVWQVLDAAGVYDSLNNTIRDVLGSTSGTFNLEDIIGLDKVLGVTALICVIDVVLITAVATLCAFLYNLSASLLGGVEVTLAEDE